jgi:hypothetical protein
LVLGNHEPYHSDWEETKSKVKRFNHDMEDSFRRGEVSGKFIFLDQTRYDISPTVTVLGCTLFSHIVPEQIDAVNFGLNDFYHINNWSIEAHQQAHFADRTWLNTEVESISRLEPERQIVILTHYCPCVDVKAVNPIQANSNLSSGFMTDLSNEPCWRYRNVKLWAFGHTHFNCDFEDAKTGKRVMANQRGYYFSQSKDFEEEKVIRI